LLLVQSNLENHESLFLFPFLHQLKIAQVSEKKISLKYVKVVGTKKLMSVERKSLHELESVRAIQTKNFVVKQNRKSNHEMREKLKRKPRRG
jgi:hypothetical protein